MEGGTVSAYLLHWRTRPCRLQRSSSSPSTLTPAFPQSPSHTQKTLCRYSKMTCRYDEPAFITEVLVLCLPGLEVTGSNSNEVVVRVPVNAEDCGAYRLLDMLAHPPGEGGEGDGGRGDGGGGGGGRGMEEGKEG